MPSRTRNLQVNGERLWASLMELAQIGATEKGGVRVSRPAVPGRPDPHSDRLFSVAGAARCLGAV